MPIVIEPREPGTTMGPAGMGSAPPKLRKRPKTSLSGVLKRLRNQRLADDRKSYGRGIMDSRILNNRNIDAAGYNRDILNQIYGNALSGGMGPNRNTQAIINTMMDVEQDERADPIYSEREMGDLRTAVNALNTAKLNRNLIDDMYRVDEDGMYDDLPSFAYGIEEAPMVRGQDLPISDVGMPVRAGDIYGDPTYFGGSMGTESFQLPEGYGQPGDSFGAPVEGRGNPYLLDQSFTVTGPSADEDVFFQEIDSGGPGEAFTYVGPRIGQMEEGPEMALTKYPGYKYRNPNPTELTFVDNLSFPGNMQQTAMGQYGYGPDAIVYPRFEPEDPRYQEVARRENRVRGPVGSPGPGGFANTGFSTPGPSALRGLRSFSDLYDLFSPINTNPYYSSGPSY